MLKTTAVVFPDDDSSRDMPPNSYPNPAGRYLAAVSFIAAMAQPALYPSPCSPNTDIDGNILNLDRLSEPYTRVSLMKFNIGAISPPDVLTKICLRESISSLASGEA